MQATTVCPLYWCVCWRVHVCTCKRIGSDTLWPLLALVWLSDVKTEAQLHIGRHELQRKVSETGQSYATSNGSVSGFISLIYCASVACFGDFWLTGVLNLSGEDRWLILLYIKILNTCMHCLSLSVSFSSPCSGLSRLLQGFVCVLGSIWAPTGQIRLRELGWMLKCIILSKLKILSRNLC